MGGPHGCKHSWKDQAAAGTRERIARPTPTVAARKAGSHSSTRCRQSGADRTVARTAWHIRAFAARKVRSHSSTSWSLMDRSNSCRHPLTGRGCRRSLIDREADPGSLAARKVGSHSSRRCGAFIDSAAIFFLATRSIATPTSTDIANRQGRCTMTSTGITTSTGSRGRPRRPTRHLAALLSTINCSLIVQPRGVRLTVSSRTAAFVSSKQAETVRGEQPEGALTDG